MKSDASPRVIRPKVACDSIQNVTSVFGNTLKRIKTLEVTPNIGDAGPNDHRIHHSTDRKLAVFSYRHKTTGRQVYTVWHQRRRARHTGGQLEQEGQPLHLQRHPGLRRAHPDCRPQQHGHVRT